MNTFNINTRVNPQGLKKDEYDCIIIGAGIGGLVCGNYLAKAGMKVLIVEKNEKPGGYCQSFTIKGFTFDACIHSLGSCREGGQLDKIFKDIKLDKKLSIKKANPSDSLVFGDYRIVVENDSKAVMENFQRAFPDQKINIRDFFNLVTKSSFVSLYSQLKDKTFGELLNHYFTNNDLKIVLSIFLGNLGLPSSMLSALTGMILYKEFILDGGYYPIGGMQSLSNALAEKFKEYGGDILFSTRVDKIKIGNTKVNGVITDDKKFIASKYVVSACDAKQTFFNLMEQDLLEKSFINKINTMFVSMSAFLVYLGLDRKIHNNISTKCRTLWYVPEFIDINKIYASNLEGEIGYDSKHILCNFSSLYDVTLAPPNMESIFLLLIVPFKSEKYWLSEKENLTENIIKRIENFIPNLQKNIILKESASPSTLYRYTLNTRGAGYGWASTPTQIDSSIMPSKTFIEGLFLTGHWTTLGGGQGEVSTVAYSGFNTARLILGKHIYCKKENFADEQSYY